MILPDEVGVFAYIFVGVAIATIPIKIGASLVRAGETGWVCCAMAAVVAGAGWFFSSVVLGGIAAAVVPVLAISIVLDTDMWNAVIISIFTAFMMSILGGIMFFVVVQFN